MALEQLGLGVSGVDGEVNGVSKSGGETNEGGDDGVKTARLPRWTRQEILVLIQGKRVAENRVRRGRASLGSGQMEPKWASVSSYCRRHGVNRGPVQCRKRWSNLAGDYKKIKEWESQIKEETESYWVMRNDVRRERKLPGFFDKEVYDIVDGGVIPPVEPGLSLGLAPASTSVEVEAEGFLNSGIDRRELARSLEKLDSAPAPKSDKEKEAAFGADQGRVKEKHPEAVNAEAGSTSQEERKRKRKAVGEDEGKEEEATKGMQNQLIEILERNGQLLAAQLEVQNSNLKLDREQRKNHGDSLVAVLNKLADAVAKIADKL